ncbi:MAG: Mrp/NBP35 family ATP-binding protein [Solobacterium sp.]|nr:Mrp/NBP35 family ATP-binding protein [Solobacterium sp.]
MSEVNSSNCSHDCGNCSQECGDRDLRIALNPRSKVSHVIGVVSGKGGVGKSFVTATLASALAKRNHNTAVLDADITGPSMARAFGIGEKLMGDGELIYPAKSASGIQVISTNMMLESDDQPVIWRGPIVAGIIRQFYQEVFWDDVDYMIVDMPPGTSDVPLTVFQSLPLDGILVVTSPQELVSMVVEKAVNMAKMMNVPVIGLIENMSGVICPDCGKKIEIFGKSHAKEVAAKYGIPLLASIPLREGYAELTDKGQAELIDVPEIDAVAEIIEKS